jgi:small subunit ribosomal protein S6
MPWHALSFRSWLAYGPDQGQSRGKEAPMREYELVMVVHPDLDDSAFNELVDRVKGWITDGGGQVSKVDQWGKRKLAYPIRKQNEGHYVLMKTHMSPEFCSQLDRNLRLQEPVMRYLVALEA